MSDITDTDLYNAVRAPVAPYDQQALALCDVCGWKARTPDVCLMFQHQAAPAPVAPVSITDKQILEAAEPFGAFQYADAQGDVRIAFARAVLALAAPAPVVQPVDEEGLISDYFSEQWAQEKARGMLDDFKRAHKIGGAA